MQYSQEKTSRHIDIIEKTIKKSFQNRLKESLIKEYLEVVQEDLLMEKQDEINLNLIQQDEQENVERDVLMKNFATLSENVELNRQRFESLKDSIDTLYLQSIAEKETFKRQQNDRVNKIKSSYQSEFNKVTQELEEVTNQHNKIEQELRNQISLENATKNARLYEMKGNLQRQINEKRNELVRAITEGNSIKQELDNLKAQTEQNRYKNTMYFQVNYLDQQSALSNNKANFPTSNNLQDKREYTTDKQNRFPIASEYGLIDKHYDHTDLQQVPEKEIPTKLIASNNLREKLNNEPKTFENIGANQQQSDFLNPPVSHASNIKPFSCATSTDTADQAGLKEQSFSKETAKDDDALLMDEIVSSYSSEATINLHPPRKVPKVYLGNTKRGQFHKRGK